MLVRSGAESKINSARSRHGDPTVNQLSETALKNFAVSVSADIQAEVDRALSSGAFKKVSAPTAQRVATNIKYVLTYPVHRRRQCLCWIG
jgi:hypothetical protein